MYSDAYSGTLAISHETYVGVYVSISVIYIKIFLKYEINVELNVSNSPKVKAAVPFFI